jgi:molybdopterin molybdotransferase
MSVPPGDHPFDDVRMRGFSSRTTVADALAWLDSKLEWLECEIVPVAQAAGHVLGQAVTSDCDVPSFDRSMMDGIAVRAEDTHGASTYNRLPLQMIGEVLPGRRPTISVGAGQAVRIMTGAPIPTGATAVLPAEKVEWQLGSVMALDEVSPGKNIGRRGDDIAAGTTVLNQGRILRPQDIGVLSSIGLATVKVVRQPRVRIVITGNELLPPGARPEEHRIADANGPMLSALVHRDGGIPINPGIVPDDPAAILASLRDPADIVIVSGGSSVGQEDHAPALIAQHGQLSIHGVAMRPSSPTGMGQLEGRLVFLLPGNPVSCLCAYDFFAGRAIRRLGGRAAAWPYRSATMPLRRKLVSTVGRLDYARVKIVDGKVEPLSISGAAVLSSTTRADGFVVIPDDCEGYPAGSTVTVYLYD